MLMSLSIAKGNYICGYNINQIGDLHIQYVIHVLGIALFFMTIVRNMLFLLLMEKDW